MEIRKELEAADLRIEEPENLARDVARRIHEGQVVGRFAGRMEYGPRALGNRSILYHAREAEVNQWLNKRLGRTAGASFNGSNNSVTAHDAKTTRTNPHTTQRYRNRRRGLGCGCSSRQIHTA